MKVQIVIICVMAFIPMMSAHASQTVDPIHFDCNAYAEKAIKQYEINRELGCNFSGARWNSEYRNHYRWCKSVHANKASLQAETQARKNDLKKCN